jgi:SAM-dependent methyltransferase
MSVFNSLYADQYDHMYSDKNYSSECDLVEAASTLHYKGAERNVLDIGCGTGGHSIELARRGYSVTGVDISEAMLTHAAQKAQTLSSSERPSWVRGDARDFKLNSQYDIAIMMFAVVGYLTTNSDVISGLRNIRKHLREGAIFICDFWYGPSVLSIRPTDRVRVVPTSQGKVVRAATTRLDIPQHTAEVTFRLWNLARDKPAVEEVETHIMRYYFPKEFALLLSISGFEMLSLSAFPTLDEPLSDNSWNALSVARAV